jgi:hypothetical protein
LQYNVINYTSIKVKKPQQKLLGLFLYQTLFNTTTELPPPKPKLLEIAKSIFASRAAFGT